MMPRSLDYTLCTIGHKLFPSLSVPYAIRHSLLFFL